MLSSHLILYGIILSIKTCVDIRIPGNIESLGYNAGKFLIYPIIFLSFLALNILMFSQDYVDEIFKSRLFCHF